MNCLASTSKARLKRSFGTALKLGDSRRPLSSLLMLITMLIWSGCRLGECWLSYFIRVRCCGDSRQRLNRAFELVIKRFAGDS